MADKLGAWVTTHPKAIIIAAVLLLIPGALGYAATGVNYDILSYLPGDLPSVHGLDTLSDSYEMAASSVLIIEEMSAKDVLKVKKKAESISGVESVIWVDDIADITIPAEMLPKQLTDIFYSRDFASTLLLVRHSGESSGTQTLDAIDEMRDTLGRQCFISGLSAVTADTRALSGSSTLLYTAVAVLLTLAALLLTQGSAVMPLIVLLSLGFAVVYNMGTNFVFGEISFITKATATVLQLGVTMDYSVILIDRFEEERRLNVNDREAMAKAVSGCFLSILTSSLTTIFGFLALCFMSLTIGLDIGPVMAKGVLFGIFTVLVLLPALILTLHKSSAPHLKRIVPNFGNLNEFTVRHSKAFAVIFLALIIPSYLAKSNVDVFYNMAKTMPQDTGSVAAITKLREDFGLSATHFALFDESLPPREAAAMLSEIGTVSGVSTVLSEQSVAGAAIPRSMLPESLVRLCTRDGYSLAAIFSSLSSGTDEANAQIDSIKDILSRYCASPLLTGDGVLTHDLIEVASRDFRITGVISIVSIFILMAICFKSLVIPALLVLCVELAVFINGAVPFFTGTEIPFISPTIIGCVQLGATVDYAILLTNRMRQERRRGSELRTAVITAANSSAKSIFCSALVLFAATAGVYFVCDIVMVQSICSMLARGAVISAAVIILFLTPLLYIIEGYFDKRRLKTFCIGRNEHSLDS